jgi:hypothetical protein
VANGHCQAWQVGPAGAVVVVVGAVVVVTGAAVVVVVAGAVIDVVVAGSVVEVGVGAVVVVVGLFHHGLAWAPPPARLTRPTAARPETIRTEADERVVEGTPVDRLPHRHLETTLDEQQVVAAQPNGGSTQPLSPPPGPAGVFRGMGVTKPPPVSRVRR